VTDLFKEFKNVPNDQKKEFGQVLNELKDLVADKVQALKHSLKSKDDSQIELDLTLPGDAVTEGSRHPLSIVRNEIIEIFTRLGFYNF
jgi:phenylalanyl-tRNA synthetase alpha chain